MTTIAYQYGAPSISGQEALGVPAALASRSVPQRPHVLVVDDDPGDLGLVADALGSDGYTVTAVDSGRLAVEYHKAHYLTIDAVVLDMEMQDLNGLDVLYHMKHRRNSVQVILTTGIAGLSVREMITHGASALLIKPFSNDQLRNKLEQCLGR